MLVHLRVFIAFFGTRPAGDHATFQLCPNNGGARFRLPGQQASGDLADIGAVLIDADATDERLHLFLSKTGIGADRTGVGAIKAGGRTGYDIRNSHVPQSWLSWVRYDHFLNQHRFLLFNDGSGTSLRLSEKS
jgi:hypothetical protein